MADETQNAVAGAQTATQGEQKVVPFIYYYSDPDEADQLLHHLPIPSFIDLSQQIMAGKLWHIYNIPAPADGMEDPVVDVRTNTWVENNKNAQTKVLAEAQAKIEELDQKSEQLDQANDKVDQATKTLQRAQAQSSQQNLALMKSFVQQTQNTNKMLATMQQTLTMVVKSTQKEVTPEAPKTDASADQPQAATDTKQENGGN